MQLASRKEWLVQMVGRESADALVKMETDHTIVHPVVCERCRVLDGVRALCDVLAEQIPFPELGVSPDFDDER